MKVEFTLQKTLLSTGINACGWEQMMRLIAKQTYTRQSLSQSESSSDMCGEHSVTRR